MGEEQSIIKQNSHDQLMTMREKSIVESKERLRAARLQYRSRASLLCRMKDALKKFSRAYMDDVGAWEKIKHEDGLVEELANVLERKSKVAVARQGAYSLGSIFLCSVLTGSFVGGLILGVILYGVFSLVGLALTDLEMINRIEFLFIRRRLRVLKKLEKPKELAE